MVPPPFGIYPFDVRVEISELPAATITFDIIGGEDASPDVGDGAEDAVIGIAEEVGMVGDRRAQARQHELEDPSTGAGDEAPRVTRCLPQK